MREWYDNSYAVARVLGMADGEMDVYATSLAVFKKGYRGYREGLISYHWSTSCLRSTHYCACVWFVPVPANLAREY